MQDGKKTYITERRLYEFFGIRLFRKMALGIERFRHRKSNSKNINYHLNGNSVDSVRNFTGYLLYNVVCHGISLAFVVIYFAIMWTVGVEYIVLDILMCILLLINLYCIMLQRYTFIKTQRFIERQIDAKNNRIAYKIERLSHQIEQRDYTELQKEFLLIGRIKESIHNGTECVIEECDIAVLNSISKCVQGILGTSNRSKRGDINEVSLETAVLTIPKQPCVINKVTRGTARLQNLFRFEKQSNVLFGFGIITVTDDCESAYRSLVHDTSRDSIEFVFDVLFGAYNRVMSLPRGTQI